MTVIRTHTVMTPGIRVTGFSKLLLVPSGGMAAAMSHRRTSILGVQVERCRQQVSNHMQDRLEHKEM